MNLEGWHLLYEGLLLTLGLSLSSSAISLPLCLLIGVLRVSPLKPLHVLSIGYIEFFRNIPLVTVLFFVFYGLPHAGLRLDPMPAAIAGLGIYHAAYVAEIVRAGLQAIDRGQSDAGRALGFNQIQLFQRVLLPQAFRIIIPSLGNAFIALVKSTSVTGVIAVNELIKQSDIVESRTFDPFAFIIAGLLFLILTIPLSLAINGIEVLVTARLGSTTTNTVLPLRQDKKRWHQREGLQSLLGVCFLLAITPFAFGMYKEPEKFAIFAKGSTWLFLGRGLLTTLEVGLASILISLPLATLFALGRLSRSSAIRYPAIVVIEGVRALPVLLLIYFISRSLTRSRLGDALADSLLGRFLTESLGVNLLALFIMVVALALYTTAVNAETIRAGILSLDYGQTEAAMALGFNYLQRMRYVILPQAFRRILPPLIAQFTMLVKDTSLGYIVSLLELTRRSVILYQGNYNPLEMFYVVAIIYFAVNYSLGRMAQWIEVKTV
jgi:aspartate/glutamate/glutamine transport system permease protein